MAIMVLLLAFVVLGSACAGAKGEQGLQGETGATGATGPAGPQGPQGEAGPGYGVHSLSIPACAFRPETSAGTYYIDAWSELNVTTPHVWFWAPVHIPDGAVIAEISVWYRGIAEIWLVKFPFGATYLQVVETLGSGTEPVADMTKVSHEVSIPFDNQTSAWALGIWLPAGVSNTVGVSGAQIVYQLTPP